MSLRSDIPICDLPSASLGGIILAKNVRRKAKSVSNSFHSKILPVSRTGSRFCRGKFFPAFCFQDFAQYKGEGGIQQLPVVSGPLSVPDFASMRSLRPSAPPIWRTEKSEGRNAKSEQLIANSKKRKAKA